MLSKNPKRPDFITPAQWRVLPVTKRLRIARCEKAFAKRQPTVWMKTAVRLAITLNNNEHIELVRSTLDDAKVRYDWCNNMIIAWFTVVGDDRPRALQALRREPRLTNRFINWSRGTLQQNVQRLSVIDV